MCQVVIGMERSQEVMSVKMLRAQDNAKFPFLMFCF
jgi:hypothetical protein